MAEILDISLSAYKKIESAENNISLNGLKILKEKFDVSADYILYGELCKYKECWHLFNNCSENEKLRLFIRIIMYYCDETRKKFVVNSIEDTDIYGLIDFILDSKKNTEDKN